MPELTEWQTAAKRGGAAPGRRRSVKNRTIPASTTSRTLPAWSQPDPGYIRELEEVRGPPIVLSPPRRQPVKNRDRVVSPRPRQQNRGKRAVAVPRNGRKALHSDKADTMAAESGRQATERGERSGPVQEESPTPSIQLRASMDGQRARGRTPRRERESLTWLTTWTKAGQFPVAAARNMPPLRAARATALDPRTAPIRPRSGQLHSRKWPEQASALARRTAPRARPKEATPRLALSRRGMLQDFVCVPTKLTWRSFSKARTMRSASWHLVRPHGPSAELRSLERMLSAPNRRLAYHSTAWAGRPIFLAG